MSCRALVADSDPITRSQFAALLTRAGWTVETVDDGERAFVRYVAMMPDLVVADDGLSGRAGEGLSRQMRELSPRVRIVLVRGVPTDAAGRQRIREESGCDAILVRPVHVDQLTQLLSQWGLVVAPEDDGEAVVLAFGVPVQRSAEPPSPPRMSSSIFDEFPLPPGESEQRDPQSGLAESLAGAVLSDPVATDPEPAERPPEPPLEPPVAPPPEPPVAPPPEPPVAPPPEPPVAPPPEPPVAPPPEPPVAPPPEPPPEPPVAPPVEPAEAPSQAAPAAQLKVALPIPIPIPVPPVPEPVAAEPEAPPEPVATATPEVPTATPEVPTEDPPVAVPTTAPTTRSAPMAPPARITPAPPPPARRQTDPVAAVALTGATQPEPAQPSTLLPSSVSRFGDLGEMPFPRLLYELYVGTYFGVLHLERDHARRTIYFWAGIPVRVDTDQLTDSLGVILRKEGRITSQQLETAKAFALEHGTPVGVALVQTDAIHERDLLEALTRQTERKLVSTFAWREGRYVAHDDTSFMTETMLNDVRPLEVIWRGVSEHYETGALLRYFSQYRSRYIVATDLYQVQGLLLREQMVGIDLATLLDGQTTFEQALVSDPARTVDLARALYVLLVTDTVRPSDAPGKSAPTLLPPIEPSPGLIDYTALMSASERIAREYVRVSGKNAFAVLQLERDADTATIEQIFRAASARVAADRELVGLPPEDQKRAREVTRIYIQAYETLIDPDRREIYARGLDQSTAEDAPPIQEQLSNKRRALFAAEQAYEEGLALLSASEARAARAKLEEAVRIHPDEATYRVAVARAILAGGAGDDENPRTAAFDLIQQALQLDPSSLNANLEAAQLLIHNGMGKAAREHLERVLQRAPDHNLARKLLREL